MGVSGRDEAEEKDGQLGQTCGVSAVAVKHGRGGVPMQSKIL